MPMRLQVQAVAALTDADAGASVAWMSLEDGQMQPPQPITGAGAIPVPRHEDLSLSEPLPMKKVDPSCCKACPSILLSDWCPFCNCYPRLRLLGKSNPVSTR